LVTSWLYELFVVFYIVVLTVPFVSVDLRSTDCDILCHNRFTCSVIIFAFDSPWFVYGGCWWWRLSLFGSLITTWSFWRFTVLFFILVWFFFSPFTCSRESYYYRRTIIPTSDFYLDGFRRYYRNEHGRLLQFGEQDFNDNNKCCSSSNCRSRLNIRNR